MTATRYGITTTHPVVAMWLAIWILFGIGAVFWTAINLLRILIAEIWHAHRRGIARLNRLKEKLHEQTTTQ